MAHQQEAAHTENSITRMEPIGGRSINSWFIRPGGFLMALANDRLYRSREARSRARSSSFGVSWRTDVSRVHGGRDQALARLDLGIGREEKERSDAEFAALKDSFERDRSPARQAVVGR